MGSCGFYLLTLCPIYSAQTFFAVTSQRVSLHAFTIRHKGINIIKSVCFLCKYN